MDLIFKQIPHLQIQALVINGVVEPTREVLVQVQILVLELLGKELLGQ